MTKEEKAKLLAKIKALLAKTVENGATEAEAMSALEKAREIIERYQLDMTTAELEAEGIRETSYMRENPNWARSFRLELAYWIGKYCEVQAYIHDKQEVRFLGLESDALFAEWLLDALDAFVNRMANNYIANEARVRTTGPKKQFRPGQGDLFGAPPREEQKSGRTAYEERAMRVSFGVGCVDRINERLKEIINKRPQTELSRNKRGMIVRHMNEIGLHLNKSYGGGGPGHVDGKAYGAGQKAGDAATFGRPINGGAPVKALR